jgi:hypothetical protein
MDVVSAIRSELGPEWLPSIYAEKIRTGRTRSHKLDIAKRENSPLIQYTLLGIELKVGRKRFACPDLATARYIRAFARLGCREFAIPYDISTISGLADELETSWQRSLILLENAAVRDDFPPARSKLVKAMRDEIAKIGPGQAMPLFDRETRQRQL